MGVEGRGVRKHSVARRCAHHAVFEEDIIGHWVVYTAFRRQHILVVHHPSAIVEVGFVPNIVVVQVLGVEPRVALVGPHVLAHFNQILVAKIRQFVAIEVHRVVLDHVYVAVGNDHVGVVVHIGTVANKLCVAVRQMHIAIERLRVFANLIVVAKVVRTVDLDPDDLLGHCCARRPNQCHHQSRHHDQMPHHQILRPPLSLTVCAPCISP